MTGSITFEDLPPVHRGGRPPGKEYQEIAEELAEHPGEWGHIRTCATATRSASFAYHIRVGTSPSFRPKGAFEGAAREVNGEHRVYARYIGPDGEHR